MRTNFVLFCAALLVGCGAGSEAKDDGNGAPEAKGGTPAAPGPQTDGQTGKTGQAMTVVQGTFRAENLGLDNARVVAIADDQSSYWAYLDANGDFTLKVPVGFSYRLVFANQLAGGGQVKLGSVVFKSEAGYSEWFGANIEGTFNLGIVTSSELSGNGSGSGSGEVGDSSPHDDDCSCKKDDGSAKKDPSSSDGVNVCLIWPTVVLFPGVTIDAKFADKSVHVTANHDDDQTCGYWSAEGGAIIWGAPAIGTGFGFGAIQAGADIGLSGNASFNWSWSYSASSSYSWNSSAGWSGSADYGYSYSSSWNASYNSSVNYSYSSSMGIAGTVTIAGGITLGLAYEANGHVSYGGVISGGTIAGGWAVNSSSSYEASASGSVCVTAGSCDSGLSCSAGTCVEKQ